MSNDNETQTAENTTAGERARAEYEALRELRFDIFKPQQFRDQVERAVLSAHAWMESLEARIEVLETDAQTLFDRANRS